VQAGERGVEETAGAVGIAEPAVEQQLGDHRRRPQGLGQALDGGGVVRQQVPGLGDGVHGPIIESPAVGWLSRIGRGGSAAWQDVTDELISRAFG
jgi:hypothetical protein